VKKTISPGGGSNGGRVGGKLTKLEHCRLTICVDMGRRGRGERGVVKGSKKSEKLHAKH
jgi:hypothetical protein